MLEDLIERLRYQPTMSQFANKDDMIAALLTDRQEAADALEAAREYVAEADRHVGGQFKPVAWRITDGEGGYEYRSELPDAASIAWSAQYGRKWEPLFKGGGLSLNTSHGSFSNDQ